MFQNKFLLYLRDIPNANVDEIVSKGISSFRIFGNPAVLPEMIEAANRALQKDWIMIGCLGAFAFLGVFGMELNRRIPIQGGGAPAVSAA